MVKKGDHSVHGLRMREGCMIEFLLGPSSVRVSVYVHNVNYKLSHASCDPAGAEKENIIGCNTMEWNYWRENSKRFALPTRTHMCAKQE